MIAARPKILWLSHLIPYPPKGGALIRSYHLIREISKYYDVDLLAFDQKSIFPSYYADHKTGLSKAEAALSEFLNSYEFFNIPSETTIARKYYTAIAGLISTRPYTMRWLESSRFRDALNERLRKKEYEAIHCDTISLAHYITELSPQGSPITILNHHNIESDMMIRRASKQKNIFKKIYFLQEGRKIGTFEKLLTQQFSLNIVCSDQDKEVLKKANSLPDHKISIVPNGVAPPGSISRKPSLSTPKLLFIGGLSWYPNRDAVHHFFDEIWPALSSHLPSLTIDIVGKNPSEKILAHASKDHRIRVHGFVPNINTFYEQSSIYICPIRDGGGTKLKVLDALAHGVPMVAYRAACEGIEMVNDEHAIIVSTPGEFVAAIAQLLQDKSRLQHLSNSGRHLINEHYAVQRIGENYAQKIASLKTNATRTHA